MGGGGLTSRKCHRVVTVKVIRAVVIINHFLIASKTFLTLDLIKCIIL